MGPNIRERAAEELRKIRQEKADDDAKRQAENDARDARALRDALREALGIDVEVAAPCITLDGVTFGGRYWRQSSEETPYLFVMGTCRFCGEANQESDPVGGWVKLGQLLESFSTGRNHYCTPTYVPPAPSQDATDRLRDALREFLGMGVE